MPQAPPPITEVDFSNVERGGFIRNLPICCKILDFPNFGRGGLLGTFPSAARIFLISGGGLFEGGVIRNFGDTQTTSLPLRQPAGRLAVRDRIPYLKSSVPKTAQKAFCGDLNAGYAGRNPVINLPNHCRASDKIVHLFRASARNYYYFCVSARNFYILRASARK